MTFRLLFLLLILSLSLSVQSQTDKPAPSFLVAINQDNAFGFYPAVYGSLGWKNETSFTFYGLFWTNPSFGNAGSGTDLWTEMGIGIQTLLADGRLSVNPSLGLTHGSLLSGGSRGVVGDGIVPSMTAFFVDGRVEAELFAAYYKSLREEGPVTYDYLLYWIYPGIALNERLAAGLHYESFVLTRNSGGIDNGAQYIWTGAFVKWNINETYTFRFSAGINWTDSDFYSDEYYKLSVVMAMP
ncbi:MAG: hypothetical protein KDC32_03120 [Saprospiraceae bacterium]|nr:hypothetical protein [Saprospiraceae bacterium]MCB0679940.1 hypothetical protein [Saprospiraceae bacterium]